MSKNIATLLNAAMSYNERAQASRLVDSWSESTAVEYRAVTAHLLSEVQALAGKEKAENTNPNHSPIAMVNAVTKAVQTFIGGLRWLRDEKGSLETKVGNIFGQLFILPASTRSDQPGRDLEIRTWLSRMPPNERDNAYLHASENDQTEILRALQDSPLPLISDEVRMRADDARAARLYPDLYRKFIENGELLSEISAILQDCLDLGREFGLEVPPSVDELGPKIRLALDFSLDHAASRGKGKPMLRTILKDATSKDPVGV